MTEEQEKKSQRQVFFTAAFCLQWSCYQIFPFIDLWPEDARGRGSEVTVGLFQWGQASGLQQTQECVCAVITCILYAQLVVWERVTVHQMKDVLGSTDCRWMRESICCCPPFFSPLLCSEKWWDQCPGNAFHPACSGEKLVWNDRMEGCGCTYVFGAFSFKTMDLF